MTFDAALLLAGVGLFWLRKWAALLCSILAGYVALLLARTGQGMELAWSLVLCVPSLLTLRFWRSLVWGDVRHDLFVLFAAVAVSGLIHCVAFLFYRA